VGDVAAFATDRWTFRPTDLSSRQPHNRSYAGCSILSKQFVAHSRVREKVCKVYSYLDLLRRALTWTSSLASRSQRKAAPSPLQTSTTATSPPSSVTPTRTTFARTGVDHTSSSTSSPYQNLQEGPRSPKERLDDLLASEKSFYKSEDSSTESIPEGKESRLVVSWENIICLPC
jgi:hypothetical protein